jgi:hypothetical protein
LTTRRNITALGKTLKFYSITDLLKAENSRLLRESRNCEEGIAFTLFDAEGDQESRGARVVILGPEMK